MVATSTAKAVKRATRKLTDVAEEQQSNEETESRERRARPYVRNANVRNPHPGTTERNVPPRRDNPTKGASRGEKPTTKHGRSRPTHSPKENPRPRTTERNVPPPPLRENPTKVFTSVCGDNADLMERIAVLYFKPGYRIADVTYGRGAFWRKIDTAQYDFFASDLITCPQARYDFRKLPRKIYKSNSFDGVVFDPPYRHDPGPMILEANYRNAETTSGSEPRRDHTAISRRDVGNAPNPQARRPVAGQVPG